MSFLRCKTAGQRLGAVALAVAAGGALACNVDRQDVMFQKGDYVFDFLIDATLRGGFPAGALTITEFAIGATDLTVADGFDRSATGQAPYYSDSGTDFGPGWNFDGFLRNSSTDPRLPALVEDDVTLPAGDGFVIGDPAEVGLAGHHNPFTEGVFTGLKPNTTYVVAFFRYGLQVNGTLDEAQMLLGEAVDNPDQLVPLGGSPAGNPAIPIISFPTIIPFQANANPFVLGNFTTDAAGEGFFDVVINGSGGELYQTTSGAPSDADFDLSLVARNDDTETTFPRYNYLVLLEGVAVDAADAADNPQAVRVQMAQDVVVGTGETINNAYAPFPDAGLDVQSLLALPCCAGQASSLELTFDNLMGLQGGVYQVWLWNAETEELISPNGDWVATEPDAEGNPVEVGSGTDVNSFASQAGWTHTFTTSDAQAGQPVGNFTHAFLSKESSAAGSPSASQPLWAQFTEMAGAPEDPFQWTFNSPQATSFGEFGSGDPTQFVMGLARGEGGFWGEQLGNSDRLIVVYRNLPLPPTGYFYEAYLVASDGTQVNAGDLLSVAAEGYNSLRDIDQDPTLTGFVNERDGIIIESETRTVEADLPAGLHFYDFVEYRLILSPKDRVDAMPPTTVLGNETPEPLRKRQPEPENGG